MPKQVLKTVQMAMFVAISVVLVYFIHFPLIPSAPFLEYDMADIPVMLGALLLGPAEGIIILLAACLIQALTVSAASGWIGFVMHFVASAALVMIAAVFYRKHADKKHLILGLVCGTLAMTVIMIPLNLIFTGIFLGAGTAAVKSMLIPAIIPFNLLKASINSVVTFIVFLPVKKGFDNIKERKR